MYLFWSLSIPFLGVKLIYFVPNQRHVFWVKEFEANFLLPLIHDIKLTCCNVIFFFKGRDSAYMKDYVVLLEIVDGALESSNKLFALEHELWTRTDIAPQKVLGAQRLRWAVFHMIGQSCFISEVK